MRLCFTRCLPPSLVRERHLSAQLPSVPLCGPRGQAAPARLQQQRQGRSNLNCATTYWAAAAAPKRRAGRARGEADAVSLLRADAVAAAIAAKEEAWGAACGEACGEGPAGQMQGHAAKLALALPRTASDSLRRSWRLGTEVQPAPGGCGSEPRRRSSVVGASADGDASVELQGVMPGPFGQRTSSEKERALLQAGLSDAGAAAGREIGSVLNVF